MKKTEAPDPTDLKVEAWPIDNLIPYEKNAKLHTEEETDVLVHSIRKFGWTQPITVDKAGVIIAGHGRRLAAIKLGFKKVPVIVRADLTEEEAQAARVADNKAFALGYDDLMLAEELSAISEKNVELLTGIWSEKELDHIDGDLGALSEGDATDELADMIKDQEDEKDAAVEAADSDNSRVVKALGFSTVTNQQHRAIRRFMINLEETTGKAGAEAFVDHIEAIDG